MKDFIKAISIAIVFFSFWVWAVFRDVRLTLYVVVEIALPLTIILYKPINWLIDTMHLFDED